MVPIALPTPSTHMPGFRRGRSLHVQDRTRSMSATASSHARSSLQDHATSLTLLLHVFAPHLLNMGNHLPCPRILTACPSCTPSFRASPKPSGTRHTLRHRQGRVHLQERFRWTSDCRQDRIHNPDYRLRPCPTPRTRPRCSKVLPRCHKRPPITPLPVRRLPVPYACRKPIPLG
jgi:hypothetical protein